MIEREPLRRLEAAALVEGYAAGRFTPVDAARACLARARDTQASLNAWVLLDEEGALASAARSEGRWRAGQPLSPLDGVPLGIKDNLHVAGWPTRWGSRLASDEPRMADEEPVARLRAAGAVFLGKTNLPEFAMQGFTDNLLSGTTRNPWDTRLTPGGSSGGAAAAVACGAGPLALVTDGGGSTRRPASHCGLVGFKPSTDLVPRGGGLPDLFHGYETVGAIGRTVRDVRAMLEVLAGRALDAPVPSKLRVLYTPRFADHPLDARIAASVDAAAETLAGLGHHVERGDRFDAPQAVHAAWPRLSAAGLAWLASDAHRCADAGLLFPFEDDALTAGSRRVLADGRAQPAQALDDLVAAANQLAAAMGEVFSRHDVLLTPCTAALPWPAQQPFPAEIDGRAAGPRDHAVYTSLANAAGLPAVALPTGPAGGLPTGLQLIGPAGGDARLLALAAQFEQAAPWANRWPAA